MFIYILIFIFLALVTHKRKKLYVVLFCLLTITISYELISFGLQCNTATNPKEAYPLTNGIRFLKNDKSIFRVFIPTYNYPFLPNSLTPFNIESIGGYSSCYSKRYKEYIELTQIDKNKYLKSNRIVRVLYPFSPLISLINVKYTIYPPSVKINSPKFELVYDNEVKIYKNLEYFSRFFFVNAYMLCKNNELTINTLHKYKFKDFREKVILEQTPFLNPDMRNKIKGLDQNENSVNILHYYPNNIMLEVSAKENGFLVISNSFNIGWKAWIDGNSTEIMRANYIMQAIPVPKGLHNIVLKFEPSYLSFSLIFSFIAWFIALLVLLGLTVYFLVSKK